MRRRTDRIGFLTALVAFVGVTELLAQSVPPDPFKSVKVSHVVLRRLVSEGHAGSDTFRRLVQDLDASGWLVFVQPGPCPEKAAVACLLHVVGAFEGSRYVRVLVNYKHRHPDNVIATLAHELQHALEVAQAPDVNDTATMRALFERIGIVRVRSATAMAYETEAARRVGEQVLRELDVARKTRADEMRGASGARRGRRSSRMSVRDETAPSDERARRGGTRILSRYTRDRIRVNPRNPWLVDP